MGHKLKTLTVALGAFLALSAVMASFASATTTDGEFTASSYPVTLTGSQIGEHVFTIEGGLTTKCKKVTFHGTVAERTTTPELTPTWTECTAFGLGATVNGNGCAYTFHIGETTAVADEYDATVDITCPTGKTIVINAGFGQCEVTVGPQTGLTTALFRTTTAASPHDIDIIPNLTKIAYTKVKDAFGCPLSGTGVKSDGTYVGEITVIGDDEIFGVPIGFTITH